MRRDVAALLKEALALSDDDRLVLVEALLASLDGHVDDGVDAAWKAEIERRIAELDTGAVSPIPWPKCGNVCSIVLVVAPLLRLRDGLDLHWVPASRDDVHRR